MKNLSTCPVGQKKVVINGRYVVCVPADLLPPGKVFNAALADESSVGSFHGSTTCPVGQKKVVINGRYVVCVPANLLPPGKVFNAALAEETMGTRNYRVGKRDTLRTIAARYNTNPIEILRLNEHLPRRKDRNGRPVADFADLVVGQVIRVPDSPTRRPQGSSRGRATRVRNVAGLGDLGADDCPAGFHLVEGYVWDSCVFDQSGQACGNGGTYNDDGDCKGESSPDQGGGSDSPELAKILGSSIGLQAYNAWQSGQSGEEFASSFTQADFLANVAWLCSYANTLMLVPITVPFGLFLQIMCKVGGQSTSGQGTVEGGGCKLPGGGDGVVVNGTCVFPCGTNEYYSPSDDLCGCERPGYQRLDPNDVNSQCIAKDQYPQPCGKTDGDGFYIMQAGGPCIFGGSGDTCVVQNDAEGYWAGTFNDAGACIYDGAKTANIDNVCNAGETPWREPAKKNSGWFCLAPCGANEQLDMFDGMCACKTGFVRNAKDPQGDCIKKTSTTPSGGGPDKVPPEKKPAKKAPPVENKPTGGKKDDNTKWWVAGGVAVAGLAAYLGLRKKK